MNAIEVKKVIEASIFNPTMRRDAKDFVDAQEKRITELEKFAAQVKETSTYSTVEIDYLKAKAAKLLDAQEGGAG